MVERFFSTIQQPSAPITTQSMNLLSGPPACGKTSLLFQFAINRALESTREVVFICSKRKLESRPPFLSQDIDPSSDVLERIQVKYIQDDEGIKKYFAAFHLYERFPCAVIIDDFADFFDERNCQQRYGNARGRDVAMVRTLAVCQNAIAHANSKMQPLESCTLLLGDVQQGDAPRFLFIYKRWINSYFTIQGDGSGSYILKESGISCSREEKRKTRVAKYSTALQYLVLDEIIETEPN